MNNTSHPVSQTIEPSVIPSSNTDTDTLAMVVKIFMCSIVFLVSLVGNIIVILVVFKTKKMQTATYFLIVNLSISDLLYTVIAIPPLMMGILGYGLIVGGSIGSFLCKIMNAAAFGLMSCSVLTLATISCDRFFAIVFPLKKLNIRRYLKSVISVIWVSSILVMSPMLYATHLGTEENFFYCYEDWSPLFDTEEAPKTYTIVLFIVMYLIPFTTMSILYSCICYYLWFRKIPGNVGERHRRREMNNRRKVIRMLVTIVVCFVLCWLPLQVGTFSVYFGNDTMLPFEFFFASEFLIRANGAVNPIIYIVFDKKFNLGFKRVLCSLWKLKQRREPTTKNSSNYNSRKFPVKETQV